MHTPKQHSNGFISAVFSYEFIDDDVIERIHRGAVDDWIADITGLGMFSKAEVRALAHSWRSDPKSLLDALLADVDEVTVKRCEVAWANLDRVAPPAPDAVSGSTGHSREVLEAVKTKTRDTTIPTPGDTDSLSESEPCPMSTL